MLLYYLFLTIFFRYLKFSMEKRGAHQEAAIRLATQIFKFILTVLCTRNSRSLAFKNTLIQKKYKNQNGHDEEGYSPHLPLLLPAKNKQLHNLRNRLTVTNTVPSNSLEHIQLFSEHVSGTMLTFMNRSISASRKIPACFSLLTSSASRAT